MKVTLNCKQLSRVLVLIIFVSCAPAFSKPIGYSLKRMDELLAVGKYSQVIDLCKQELTGNGIKSNNTLAEIHSSLALAYMYLKKNELAKTEAKKAISFNKANHEAHWVLSNIYMSEGRSDEGSAEYLLSVKHPSKRPCKPCAKKKIDRS